MPRETRAQREKRTRELLRTLERIYPDAHCELDHSNAFELLIATILSAQCSDKQVNKVTPDFFRRFPNPGACATAPVEELEGAIRSIGLFRAKARNIRAASRMLMDRHGGQVPDSMEELKALDGVGRKTANVVLGNAFQRNEGVVVDTHVGRLSRRLGLSRQTSPEKIETDLMRIIPREDWARFSHWLIWHGRRRCRARKPDCEHCELVELCPSRGRA